LHLHNTFSSVGLHLRNVLDAVASPAYHDRLSFGVYLAILELSPSGGARATGVSGEERLEEKHEQNHSDNDYLGLLLPKE
jgi:hypothetical protein